MKDTVSIITTFYNCEDYILQCIHSVNSQVIDENFNIEYILVNDCSKDKSLDLINEYFKKYENADIKVKIINMPENSGCGASRKFGISNASGLYLMFLDGDDYYINNDFVLRAYNCIKENNADIVEYGFKYIRNGERIYTIANNQYIINDNINGIYAMFYENLIKFMPWTKIIRKEITNIKSYDTSREYEDIRTTPYWVINSKKIIIINSIEINYRQSNNSIINYNTNSTRYGTVLAISSLFDDAIFNSNINLLKALYDRTLVDMRTIVELDSDDEYYRKMSKLNTKMLSYIYPDNYKDITYDIE